MKSVIRVIVLSILCGFIIWHVIYWHSTEMYTEIFSWIGTDSAYLTVLYSLGLMILFSLILGLLMCTITDLLGLKYHETDHPNSDDKAGT